MSVEENIRVIDAATKAANERDWDRFLGFHAESVIVHTPDRPEPLKGREEARQWLETKDSKVARRRATPFRAIFGGQQAPAVQADAVASLVVRLGRPAVLARVAHETCERWTP